MLPKTWWQLLLLTMLAAGFCLVALIGLAGLLIYPDLPSLDSITDYHPKIPLRVYTEDGFLIGEFGEERRAFVKLADVPAQMKNAILATEDKRFYEHGGIDTIGVLRAAITNVGNGSAREGASTITMQVARNFFLSSEKSLKRKLSEALLAIKIENSLSKDQILELYINQIYLGQRSYGFAAAAQVYFGKHLDQLTIGETAILAGLPKAPSGYNPYVNPKAAKHRQEAVLRKMLDQGFITQAAYDKALEEPLKLARNHGAYEVRADYVAEIVRQNLFERYHDDIYKSGLKVYTTIKKTNQEAANTAVLQGILEYDKRHGYRGPEGLVKPEGSNLQETFDDALSELDTYSGLEPAIVTQVNPKAIKAYHRGGETVEITGDGLSIAQKMLNDKDVSKQKLKLGSVIRITNQNGKWILSQLPQVEAAFIGMDPKNGATQALVGGFDFNRNKFNHVTQAWRQPGSSFKPFIYSASLEKGFTPASVIDDEPLYLSAEETGSGSAWEPHNFDGKFEGPMRMRTALTKSKNMVSIRILQNIGVSYAQDYITRFGFLAKDHPAYLAMALGAGAVTPWQMASAYSVFANGGFHVNPYLIAKITDSQGKVIEEAKPLVAGVNAPRMIDARNAYLMTSMMQDVARIGTAAKARELGRYDLAGKTGTTNNQNDAWFAGFNPAQVGIAWIGFDQPKSLGGQETGGHAALPMWISYMSKALQNYPDEPYPIPQGIVSAKINPNTGLRVGEDESGIYESFYQENLPAEASSGDEPATTELIPGHPTEPVTPDQLF